MQQGSVFQISDSVIHQRRWKLLLSNKGDTIVGLETLDDLEQPGIRILAKGVSTSLSALEKEGFGILGSPARPPSSSCGTPCAVVTIIFQPMLVTIVQMGKVATQS